LIENPTPAIEKRVATSIVKDSKTGDLIIKLVNLLPSTVNTQINLGNNVKAESQATRTVLTGMPHEKNNVPIVSEIKVGNNFTYEMPAYSVSVIRIK
jgi:alpha-L-arabinofuranosidase